MSTLIEEKEYEKKINISKYNFTCDAIDDTIPKPLPQKGGFGMLIIGKPGMGKTTLILSLILTKLSASIASATIDAGVPF